MQIHGVLPVDIDSLCEILDGLLKLKEPIPNQASAVVRRSILRINLYNQVEVLQSEVKLVTTHLLSYSPKMMQGLNILRLELHRTLIILLRLFVLAQLVPTKRSVIIGLEMLWVNTYSILVVLDGAVKLSLLAIGKPSVMIEVSLRWLDFNSLGETLNSFIVVSFPVKTNALVVICVRIVGVY